MSEQDVLDQIINVNLDGKGHIKALKKNNVIKNVEYVTQSIGGKLVTVKLVPPRNLKVTNKLKRKR